MNEPKTPHDPAQRQPGESLSDDRLAAIVDSGGEAMTDGEAASIAAELLARRAGDRQREKDV
jgi:hypothetical protein